MSLKRWHYDVLREFHKLFYYNLLDQRHLTGQKALEGFPYWVFNKDKVNFIYSVDQDHPIDYTKIGFPMKILQYERYIPETGNNTNVFYEIKDYQSLTIPKEKKMSFRQLVDDFVPFNHSNPEHWLIFRLIIITSYIYRINVRMSTAAGFGKDSAINCLRELTNKVTNLSASTMAKFEYSLLCKIFVLNEISDINAEDRRALQKLLLTCGDFKTEYEKSTREAKGTQERYDISTMSIVLFYNLIEHYRDIATEDKFFDNMFTQATRERILPFRFEGQLTMDQFREQFDPKMEFLDHLSFYQDFLSTLEYYKDNPYGELKPYKLHKELKLQGRHPLSFDKICNVINMYAETEDEYNALIDLAFECHVNYYKAMQDHKTLESFSGLPMQFSNQSQQSVSADTESDSESKVVLEEQIMDNSDPEKPIKANLDKYNALAWIEKNDTGKGASEVTFLEQFKEKGEPLLDLLKSNGEIIEIRAGWITLND